jgi:hypothetical protein
LPASAVSLLGSGWWRIATDVGAFGLHGTSSKPITSGRIEQSVVAHPDPLPRGIHASRHCHTIAALLAISGVILASIAESSIRAVA